jgi:uncharacterized membrane protein
MDPNISGNFEEQIRELRSRVLRLEEALRSHGVNLQEEEGRSSIEQSVEQRGTSRGQPPSSPSAGEIPHQVPPPPAPPETPLTPPRFASPQPVGRPEAHQDDRTLESRIGSQWFNRIGILAVLIGMAWFLKLAVDNRWIGPLGRVLIGLGAGAGLIAWSERFHRRGYAGFAYSLKAVGSGILYLSLWAAFSLFHLIPASVAFAAMIVVTAFNGFMSWLQDSELLALYSIVGGLSTPLLISTHENHEVALFSYLLLLNLAVTGLVFLRPWSRLLFGAFTGTVLFFTGWWFSYYSNAQFARTAFFLGCFFLIFAFAPRLVRLDAGAAVRSGHWDRLALVLLPISNAGLGFLAFYAMLESSRAGWAEPWLAVIFAAFYLLLLRLPARGMLHRSPATLSALHVTAAVVFLTISIPLEAHGRWLTIGWLVQGAALLWVASRVCSRLVRVLALLCLALGLSALVIVNPPASTTPFLNERFGTYCAAIAVFAFTAWLAGRTKIGEDPADSLRWTVIAAAAALAVNALILLAMSWEIHSYWWLVRWRGNWALAHDYRMYAQFTYSALFMALGAILLGAGFWRRSAFVRWQALVLLAVAIGKVFLVDVSELSQGYRILSFLGLGALLLAVSFVYQRDWLNLRGPDRVMERRTS